MFYKCTLVGTSILWAVATFCLTSVAFGEEHVVKHGLHPIFDARKIQKESKPTKQEIALLKREVESAAATFWKKRGKICDEPQLEVIDVTMGSFTKSKSNQEAILYKYCTTGHNFALDGIAILENNHVVAHILYEGAWDLAIEALPDINGNGLTEMLVSTGGSSTGEIWGVIKIIEIAGNVIRKFGHTDTYSSDGGRETDERKVKTVAKKLWVKSGTTPKIYRETYIEKTNRRKSKWVKTGKLDKMLLDNDETEYYIIKRPGVP
jgi:hypothetical protein